jgi:hypothetical protein
VPFYSAKSEWLAVVSGVYSRPSLVDLLEQMMFLPAFVVYAVFGTLWWYLISCGIRWLFRDDVLKKRQRALD